VPAAGAAQRLRGGWRWTTGWRPSTLSGRGRRHLGGAALAGRRRPARWAWTAHAAGRRRRQRRRHAGRGGRHPRTRRRLPLALQLLITPGTAAHADTPSHRLFANGFLLDAAAIAWFFDHYIPYHHRRDWRFAPLQADDLDGVAPACVILAECDPLVDEGLAYADRLRAAGVAVELELFRGLTHDFIKMGRVLKEAGRGPRRRGLPPCERPCSP
jgi:hypothetical protein